MSHIPPWRGAAHLRAASLFVRPELDARSAENLCALAESIKSGKEVDSLDGEELWSDIEAAYSALSDDFPSHSPSEIPVELKEQKLALLRLFLPDDIVLVTHESNSAGKSEPTPVSEIIGQHLESVESYSPRVLRPFKSKGAQQTELRLFVVTSDPCDPDEGWPSPGAVVRFLVAELDLNLLALVEDMNGLHAVFDPPSMQMRDALAELLPRYDLASDRCFETDACFLFPGAGSGRLVYLNRTKRQDVAAFDFDS